MHKKLAADLTSLAHSILQMKNKEDVFALKSKAYELYEKLAVLAYIEEYINNTPNPEHSKEELITLVENATKDIKKLEVDKKEEAVSEVIDAPIEQVAESLETEEDVVKHQLEDETSQTSNHEVIEKDKEEIKQKIEGEVALISEQPLIDFDADVAPEEIIAEPVEEKVVDKNTHNLEEELKDTIAVDVVADLFENAPKKSLNDRLQGDIQIGLNDRIAFVKNLFGGSQEDFNRVVSQLNTLKTEKEAKKFINKMVKPDYDWTNKEELEERFMLIIARKFV